MRKKLYLFILMILPAIAFASDRPAYKLFAQGGKEVKYTRMLKDLADADIIFFGELHTDPIAHWLQLEMTQDLFNQKREALVLGAEMFESDNQLIMNEYLADFYETDKFEAEMRLWNNYQTDYKPLVEFARTHGIPIVATNIPRRYASMVYKKGFEGLDELTEEAKHFIAPLPIRYDPELPSYKKMLNMGHTGVPDKTEEAEENQAPEGMKDTREKDASEETEAPGNMPGGHGSSVFMNTMENLPKAQAAKDATMAYFILENWSEGKTLFHLNGTYHSDNFEGIVWHLKQQNPGLKIKTIATVQQSQVDDLDEAHEQLGSYILCVPENMTRTHR